MKTLLKILIGAAWIDGIIQPEERRYLRRVAQEFQLANDPEIRPLLSELRPVQPIECYQWLEDYLGEDHSHEDYLELLEKISGLIYSDGYVDIREAKLIEKIEHLDSANESNKKIFNKLLRKIQKLYRSAMEQHV
ncbi:TerB family tellurite resistance protein [Myxosarcina sp. GI1]|uniref:tellurite resistance TerB family protein n=1 Tax=Myxosarcina sp. GI1 TaxID=1541065 RepID=UPI00155AC661|nr:TerB family tellurite resistance protein [Myxosarcina sp. GI1]